MTTTHQRTLGKVIRKDLEDDKLDFPKSATDDNAGEDGDKFSSEDSRWRRYRT